MTCTLSILEHDAYTVQARSCHILKRPGPPPLIVSLLAVSRDLVAIPEELHTSMVLSDAIESLVEVGHFGLRAEHLRPQHIAHTTLQFAISTAIK